MNHRVETPEHLKENKYTYVYVEYEDDIGGKLYCYRTKDNAIKKGSRVLVERNDEEVCARVISVRQYNIDEIPYPLDKTKSIIEKVSEHFNPDYEVIDCKYFYGDDVILSYTLSGALMEFENTLMIIDKKENNIIVNDKLADSIRFTIPYDDIKRIKNIIKNDDKLFNIKEIPMPPVLDGSMHEFYLSTKNNIISLVTWNLWYWLEEEEMPKEVKIIISIINEINKILMQYDLKIDIGDN